MSHWARLLLLLASCGSCGGGDYAGGAATAGIAIAKTGVYRAATGGCVATCAYGTECDEVSGKCVPVPCGGCPADHACRRVEGREECVAGGSETATRYEKVEGGRQVDQQPDMVWCYALGIMDCPSKPVHASGADPVDSGFSDATADGI